ncbi:RNA deprotection pyrophosphohydrolase [Fredinandcohnia quinoae]|uniref:Nucleoside triphosphatase YtkD n=1 Tax=Fredinandcohnia quinoae TaxID=2918902 RepID=A0AAW5DYH0_9BACI|nr:nucleoside triphosphatase YtkD [Fredinandcohnia sp. SECRCQ15]MCH1625418.1 nucleoside triphosphatase YtkD [Fredinandcohnia sp. SECRCQ15]
MIVFQDAYQNEVNLSFTKNPFSNKPKHVWVLCKLQNQWLLTNHRERGLEFPGGKVEDGETPEEAAIREVSEETGGKIKNLQYIGQYKVFGKGKTIVKNIYYAVIDELLPQSTYYETKGPVLLTTIPLVTIPKDRKYSFIMKDDVLRYSLAYVHQYIENKKILLD